MESVFNSLVQILGKRNTDPAVIAILASFGELSRNYDIPGGYQVSEFNDMGIGTAYDLGAERFYSVSVELSGKQVREGKRKPFPSPIYAAIASSDHPKEIELKLGASPKSLQTLGPYWRVRYEVGPHLLDCLFELEDGPIQAMTVYSIDMLKEMFKEEETYELFVQGISV